MTPPTFARWQRVFDRVRLREMPPQDSERVIDSHHASFLEKVGKPLREAHASRKGTVLRRLNRSEYEHTLNDLFGTELELKDLLPEDGRSHEFDNVGETLNISSVQLREYLAAIDLVLDAAIAKRTEAPKPEIKKCNYADTREGEKHIGKAWGKAPDGSVVFYRALGYPTGMLRTASASKTGRYKIRVTGYAYQSDKPVTFAVGATTFQRGVDKPTFGYFSLPPGKPTTIELEVRMKQRFMVEITPWGIYDDNYEIKRVGIDNYEGPGLAIKEVQLEGPLVEEFPGCGHRLVFDGLNRTEVEPSNPSLKTKSWYVPKFEVQASEGDIEAVLSRVASTAFRRPTSKNQVQPFIDLYRSQMEQGSSVEESLRSAIAAIFCSPDFLFLREQAGWLDDYALASRISYLLTRTIPDTDLLDAAESGDLTKNPKALLAQVRRLMKDERFDRFLVDFTDAWLNLRDIEFTSPDKNLFPEFDQFLQFSMLEETRSFLRTLIDENLSVRNLVQSDFAMLNNRLAKLYEVEGVDGPDVRKVSLPDGSVRGGLLSQASILKVSANGTNTSPVVRGVWVLERILGEHTQPPPPGIPGVEPDIRGATTLRELLDKHRDVDSCRACHAKIDPLGFALESFNPIGGYRDRFRSLGEGERVTELVFGKKVRYKIGPAVDASGQFENGKKFDGYLKFRSALAADEDRLAKTFVTKLLTFATGREMGFSDRQQINKIVAKSKANGHKLKDLIELVVVSEIFRRK